MICSLDNPCHTGRVFDAQVSVYIYTIVHALVQTLWCVLMQIITANHVFRENDKKWFLSDFDSIVSGNPAASPFFTFVLKVSLQFPIIRNGYTKKVLGQ